MVRILSYVAIVFVLAFGFAWLADRPGVLQLTWQGYTYEVSLVVAVVAIIVVFALLLLLVWLVRTFVTAPRVIGGYFASRRRDRGYRALSRGMVAVGAGDRRTATRAADEAVALLGEEPMTLLLTAQAAQLGGNGDLARKSFEKLAARQDSRVLGLHGLFVEARRQGEGEAARHFAEEAMLAAPRIGWAGEALFEYQAQAGDWLGALRTLGSNAQAKLVDKATAQRLRAVLLTAWAGELESSDPHEARAHAQEAHRLAPAFSEAAVVAGRLLSRAGDYRRASRVLETTWKAAPHPEIAETYARVRPGDSVMDRLKRMRRLAELRPNHPEGAMAVARAAIDAHDWEAARAALEGPARSQPSERVCVLMAEIEQNQYGDEGRVRSWLARAINAPRDPAWVADGRIFQHWAPISPISGRIDAFEWKVPSEPTSEPRMPLIDLGPDLTLPAVAAALAEPQEVTGTEQADTSTADGTDEPDVVDIAPMKSGEVAEVSAESEDKGEVEGNDDKGKESEVVAAPTPVEPASQPTASDEAPPEQQTEADESPSARPTDDETPSTRPAEADGDAVSPAATTSEKAESSAPLAESPTPTAEQPDAEESVKPVVPPIPDDPGPEPRDESETPRRFRLFGSSA